MTEINSLKEYFIESCRRLGITLSENEISKFFAYKDLLISWNKKINLTSITDEKEIILKHFTDSLSVIPYIEGNKNIIDIGTGAGFPGIPLKILRPDMELTLLDSLNKRIVFLKEVVDKLGLTGVNLFHGRAETAGKDSAHRESYSICTSRAVAPLNALIEYCLPFTMVGGSFLAMKGGNAQSEINEAGRAVAILGGKIDRIESFSISAPGMDENLRTIIEISKIKKTPEEYPRREGLPSRKPL